MLAAIITELRLTESTLGTRRNIQDLTCSTDLLNAIKVDTDEYTLAINNSNQNAANSSTTIGPILDFLHLTTDSSPLNVTITLNSVSVTLAVTSYLSLTCPIDNVVIENPSLLNVANVKVISA